MPTQSPPNRLAPAAHGALNYRELARLGLDPNAIIDFSDNINPYGPHPAVLQAVRSGVSPPTLARYPDRDCLALVRAIAAAEDIPTDHLLPTNGASELIQLVALALGGRGGRHLILTPTFGEYARAVNLVAGDLLEHRAAGPDYRFEVAAAAAAIRRAQPHFIWLCTPNNPTGQIWPPDDLARLRAALGDAQPLWIVDESYRYFAAGDNPQPPATAHLPPENTVIIRSLTKDQGLAGLRLGYAVAPPQLIKLLRAAQPAWSVNSLAQVAGVAAMQPEVLTWRRQSLAKLRRHADKLWAGLAELGVNVLPGAASYALVEVGDAPAFRAKLLKRGLLVRDATSFGLPQHVRIAARLPEQNQQLLAAVQKLQSSATEASPQQRE